MSSSYQLQNTLDEQKLNLREIGNIAQTRLSSTNEVREKALRLSRDIIRTSANSIRATHRGEFNQAQNLVTTATQLLADTRAILDHHPSVFYAGFVEDAQKEYIEASAILAFATGTKLVGLEESNVGPAPFLNGLAESIGELRRYILDSLRRDDFSRCGELLSLMDEIYALLVSIDFPEAVTRGLRRSTDAARGLLERTRGDLTVAIRQQKLEQQLTSFEQILANHRSICHDQSLGDPIR